MKDQSCHYCEDMIEKLNKEYDELYRILKQQEKITKQQNFINCINHINIYSTYLDEMVKFCIEEGDGGEIHFTNNSKRTPPILVIYFLISKYELFFPNFPYSFCLFFLKIPL